MIRRYVSAVLLMRDGFTGQPFSNGSALLCRLNGQPVRPLFKSGGYLVLTDLEPGEYILSLAARGFFPETVYLSITGNMPIETEISMKPDSHYTFPPDTARLRLELSDQNSALEHEEFWAGYPAQVQLRLAQNTAAGESGSVRVYCSGALSLLPVPGHFLLRDSGQPELIRLLELRNENAVPDGPMIFPHARGTVLIPASQFHTDADGCAELAFPRGGTVSLFCRGCLKNMELRPGTALLRWMPENIKS